MGEEIIVPGSYMSVSSYPKLEFEGMNKQIKFKIQNAKQATQILNVDSAFRNKVPHEECKLNTDELKICHDGSKHRMVFNRQNSEATDACGPNPVISISAFCPVANPFRSLEICENNIKC